MTNDLPDAPWIRFAETYGMPEPKPFYCPCCGAESPEDFFLASGQVIGCSECVERRDAAEWTADHEELPFEYVEE